MSYFATEYTIRYDDTMAYGSHHFLTGFKFQCAARESLLFGERVFDADGVRDALDHVHLLTVDAYARNLNPARLGDRVAILLTLEEWGRASARFCYRVIDERGRPICAGFQTLLCADVTTGSPISMPLPLWEAMERLREIEEPRSPETFRERVLVGGKKTESLFGPADQATALQFLKERYPCPQVICPVASVTSDEHRAIGDRIFSSAEDDVAVEAWVFSGQGAFDSQLLSDRIIAYTQMTPSARAELDRCAAVAEELIGGDACAIVSGSRQQCADAVEAAPDLAQVAIHLQNVLGARLRRARGQQPGILIGHSFGEIAAFGVGGCFDLPTGVRIVCERVRAIARHAPPSGGLLVVATNRPSVATEAALLGLGEVVIAGRNHEQQTVASGPRGQIEQLRDYFRSIDIDASMIPAPTSFHHPHLRLAALAWLRQLRALPIGRPALAIYSPIGRRFISPDDDIATTLASQFLRPFDFQGAIADVIEAGATRFVDCGSSGATARIIGKAGTKGRAVCGVAPPELVESKDNGPANVPMVPPAPRLMVQAAPAQLTGDTQPAATTTEGGRSDGGDRVPTVVIVGQGCILPGGACSPQRLYSAIVERRMGIVDQRHFDPHWSEDFYSEQLVPDRSTSHLTGRVNDADIVAPDGIDPNVFEGFTRPQRLLCIALAPCIPALENADRVLFLVGATADGFEDHDVVTSLRFAGIDPTDPSIDEGMNTARSAFCDPHDAVQEVVDRIVRPGLKIVLVDSACASSLYSVALGMQALESHEADVVVAGGVFSPGPGNSCLFSQFRGTSATGCRPFDASADGVVFSEGSACVALRRLADAARLKLPVAAVVRGGGLSSDGRSPSASVPQTHGQLLALERCYAHYRIDPSTIQAIEGHGTGTFVGDTTELETLRQFFLGRTQQPIPLHSLKGLLGHAGWTAGTASVIAACEYLRNGRFPAQACHREPSPALAKSAGTLTIPTRPVTLKAGQCRIAIDGFGFGGANAHIVLERYVAEKWTRNDPQDATRSKPLADDEVVFVACRELVPTLSTSSGLRFDRARIKIPETHVLLPDLADDMDISQTLAIVLADEIIAQIHPFDDGLRRETGVVVALSGKTERGVEATMRILASRFRRHFAQRDWLLEKLAGADDRSRPSGPYTLQCMMPNVAAGRAALKFNLNGPNFVVDSGPTSLEAALKAASLLLRGGDDGGTKLVIVGAIDANPWRVSRGESQEPEDEFAAGFAVTTRRCAEKLGWDVISPVAAALQHVSEPCGIEQVTETKAHKVRALVDALTNADSKRTTKVVDSIEIHSSAESQFPIHVPSWVEAPLPHVVASVGATRERAILAIVPASQKQVATVLEDISGYTDEYLVVVVGPSAGDVASKFGNANILPVDMTDEQAIRTAVVRSSEFRASFVVAVESVTSWNLVATLDKVATNNGLCEFLFLFVQHNAVRLRSDTLELWGLFLNSWDGVVHPASGAVAGLLKAVKREIATARIGIACTRDLAFGDALKTVLGERSQRTHEPEIVYDGPTRLVRRLRRSSGEGTAGHQVALDANSVVVATGGARGVTAVLMDALLRDFGCTVVALGRSSPEAGPVGADDGDVERSFYDRYIRQHARTSAAEMRVEFERARARWEVHETLERLSSLGGRVDYMVADITDREQVENVIQQIALKYGRVDLLVHGAGVQLSKRLERRSLAEFRRTYSVKVSGLHNLVEACRTQFGKTVATHVLTSAYSIFGNDGQHDYGAANETLDRLCCLSKEHGDNRWSSIAWLAWDAIGMTRGSEYRALAGQRGLSALTVESGQRVFREVIAGHIGSANNVPLSEAEHARYGVNTVPAPTRGSTGRIIEVHVELSEIPCLSHHKIRRVPTLPGAWILERMASAALRLRQNVGCITSAIFQDVTFRRFVRCATGEEPNLRIIAEEVGDGIAVWLIGDIRHATGAILAKDIVFAHATVICEHAHAALEPTLQDIASASEQGSPQFVNDPYCAGRRSGVELSGPFDCLRDIVVGPFGRRARFAADQRHNDSWAIPALLLDSAWRVGAMYAVPAKNELYVPVHIGRVITPVGVKAHECSTTDWEIRSSAPRIENGSVRWDRTEVFNEFRGLKLVVENAFATPLQ